MDPILGSIVLFPFTFTPEGWLPCDGREVSINQNQALFSLLGNTFGGNMQTVFNLPKMAAPVPNTHWAIATVGIYPQRP